MLREELAFEFSDKLAESLSGDILLCRHALINDGKYLYSVDTFLELIFSINPSLLVTKNFQALVTLNQEESSLFEEDLIYTKTLKQDEFDNLICKAKQQQVRRPVIIMSKASTEAFEKLAAGAVESGLDPQTFTIPSRRICTASQSFDVRFDALGCESVDSQILVSLNP